MTVGRRQGFREGGSRLGELRDDGWSFYTPEKNDSMAMDGKST